MNDGTTAPESTGLTALSFGGELQRKALHLMALGIPAGMMWLDRGTLIALLIPLAVLAVSADFLRARSPAFARIVSRIFGRMMRPSELDVAAGSAVINGATWVLISAATLTVLFPAGVAAPAFAAFMVGDAAAAILGLRFGRRQWPGTDRTIVGSAAFILVSFLCLMPFPNVSSLAAALSTLFGAAAEIPDWRINDNLRVPLVMAVLLTLLGA